MNPVMLCGKNHNGEKIVRNLTAVRLPLRHEVGERAGVRWCLGFRGRSCVSILVFVLAAILTDHLFN